jgi:hypothetical protein
VAVDVRGDGTEDDLVADDEGRPRLPAVLGLRVEVHVGRGRNLVVADDRVAALDRAGGAGDRELEALGGGGGSEDPGEADDHEDEEAHGGAREDAGAGRRASRLEVYAPRPILATRPQAEHDKRPAGSLRSPRERP